MKQQIINLEKELKSPNGNVGFIIIKTGDTIQPPLLFDVSLQIKGNIVESHGNIPESILVDEIQNSEADWIEKIENYVEPEMHIIDKLGALGFKSSS